MRFDVIEADPPWRFDQVRTGGSFTSGAEQVYAPDQANQGRTTMALADIKALTVPAISMPNSVLFLWVPTALKFSHGYPTMRAWGFDYKTTWYWRKTRLGMGYWGRNTVEELLIGVRGSVAPFLLQEPNARETPIDMALDGEVWIMADAGEHSAKPEEFKRMIETATARSFTHYPVIRRLELFARRPYRDWYVAGNQIDGKSMDQALLDFHQMEADERRSGQSSEEIGAAV